MKIKPMHNYIFVKPDPIVEKTKAGIYLSDFSKRHPTTGTIVALGPKVDTKVFFIGQRVVYGEFAGAKEFMELNGEEVELFIMIDKDILAVEDEKK